MLAGYFLVNLLQDKFLEFIAYFQIHPRTKQQTAVFDFPSKFESFILIPCCHDIWVKSIFCRFQKKSISVVRVENIQKILLQMFVTPVTTLDSVTIFVDPGLHNGSFIEFYLFHSPRNSNDHYKILLTLAVPSSGDHFPTHPFIYICLFTDLSPLPYFHYLVIAVCIQPLNILQ